jgi:hypothetical protein
LERVVLGLAAEDMTGDAVELGVREIEERRGRVGVSVADPLEQRRDRRVVFGCHQCQPGIDPLPLWLRQYTNARGNADRKVRDSAATAPLLAIVRRLAAVPDLANA